jgi:hypothetical protein
VALQPNAPDPRRPGRLGPGSKRRLHVKLYASRLKAAMISTPGPVSRVAFSKATAATNTASSSSSSASHPILSKVMQTRLSQGCLQWACIIRRLRLCHRVSGRVWRPWLGEHLHAEIAAFSSQLGVPLEARLRAVLRPAAWGELQCTDVDRPFLLAYPCLKQEDRPDQLRLSLSLTHGLRFPREQGCVWIMHCGKTLTAPGHRLTPETISIMIRRVRATPPFCTYL